MKCFVCEKGGKVLSFSDASFQKCLNIISFRKGKKFKHGDLHLTKESRQDYGYHIKCYKKVVILKQKYKDEFAALFPDYVNSEASLVPVEPGYVRDNKYEYIKVENYEDSDENQGQKHQDDGDLLLAETRATTSTPICEVKDLLPVPTTSANLATSANASTLAPGKSRLLCIFCSFSTKRVGIRRVQVILCNSEETRKKIVEFAKILEDSPLLNTLETCKKLYYHVECYSAYRRKYSVAYEKLCHKRKKTGIWHNKREVHKAAFKALSAFILEEIIEKERIFFLVELHSKYKALLLEFSGDDFRKEDWEDYKAEYLRKKILETFGDIIMISTSDAHHNKLIVYKIDIDVTKYVNDSILRDTSEATKLEQVAYDIRNAVKNQEAGKLPKKLKVDDIIDDESDIPDILFEFICNLIHGPNLRRKNSDDDYVKIKSLCQDIIYMITYGRVKPS